MAQSFQTNLINVASSYINVLNLSITATSLNYSLEDNPSYPDLLFLSNIFDQYSNIAYLFTIVNLYKQMKMNYEPL
jgi:hypothetical protein